MIKKNIYFIVFIFVFCLFFNINHSSAHQPNYVSNEKQILDNDPTISKAYYGELTGSDAEYFINSETNFPLYVNILSPEADTTKSELSVTIRNSSDNIVAVIGGENGVWQKWYEEFAGDYYLRGSEFKKEMPAGKYKVIVSNKNKNGKYVLAIGEIESFPIKNIPDTISQLYKVKTKFFEKSWYSIFEGKIGKTILILIVIIAIIIFIITKKFLNKQKVLKNVLGTDICHFNQS